MNEQELIKIHPFDMHDMLASASEDSVIWIRKLNQPLAVRGGGDPVAYLATEYIEFDGKRYLQTITVPPKTDMGLKMLREFAPAHHCQVVESMNKSDISGHQGTPRDAV